MNPAMYHSVDTHVGTYASLETSQELPPPQFPLTSSSHSMMNSSNNTTPLIVQNKQQTPSLLDSWAEALKDLGSSSSSQPLDPIKANQIITSGTYSLECIPLDGHLVHPTQLGTTSTRVCLDVMIQHKANPTVVHRVGRELSVSMTYRADSKTHQGAFEKSACFIDNIDTIIQNDPSMSPDNFTIHFVLKKVKSGLLDVQKILIAFSPSFTLSDFLKKTAEPNLYSFDFYKDQTLKEHVGKFNMRLGVNAYSDAHYLDSLPSGFFASKTFTVPCISKHNMMSCTIKITEKVTQWLNTYSSKIRVVNVANTRDTSNLIYVVMYEKK
ncbi:hypothetical protein C9374_007972 [Naegleria lovaniensis]|uniref:Uncharacterized protein n=1 Tax=Naegleria lovaniensis TaxID=51637 RepID=A0AA88KLF0_NAELO|nr:uncharacterized protein C9374_007972 [Naegleria lovaniensis]KAG2378824.1 hypothetical protein C9374_007972 [Naegleria lovaniensis]